jgi:hypothetical protein
MIMNYFMRSSLRLLGLGICVTFSSLMAGNRFMESVKRGADPRTDLATAYVQLYGAGDNILTHPFERGVKESWSNLLVEMRDFINDSHAAGHFWQMEKKSAQQAYKRVLQVCMDKLMHVSDAFCNTVTAAYGRIATALASGMKASGTQNLADINFHEVDLNYLRGLIRPLSKQKGTIVEVQDMIKKLPQVDNKVMQQGAKLMTSLCLILDAGIDFVFNSLKRLEDYAQNKKY